MFEGDIEEEEPAVYTPEVPENRRVIYLGDASDTVRKPGVHLAPRLNAMPSKEIVVMEGREEEGCDEIRDDANDAEEASMLPLVSCASRPSCNECLFDTSCVWCPGMNACVDGNEAGPLSALQCAQSFVYGTCDFSHPPPPQYFPRSNTAQVVACDDDE